MTFNPAGSYAVDGLKPDTLYFFSLAARSEMGLGVYTQPIEARTAQSSKSFLLCLSRLYFSPQRPLTSKCVKWMSLTAGSSRFRFTNFSVASSRAYIGLHRWQSGTFNQARKRRQYSQPWSTCPTSTSSPLSPTLTLLSICVRVSSVFIIKGPCLWVWFPLLSFYFSTSLCTLWCQHIKCHWTNCFGY